MIIGPTFFSSPSNPGGDLTTGTPTTAIFGANNTVAAQIDSTSVLVVYQAADDFYTKGVIVTDAGGGAVSFSAPVTISSAIGAIGLLAMHVLDASAGTYICTYSLASSNHYSRIVTVSGGVLTVTGTEDFIANLSTIPSASLVLQRSAVISSTFVAVAMTSPLGLYVSIGSVSGGTVTYGAPALTELGTLGGQGSRLLTGDGGVVMYGSKFGVADNRLWSCSVSSAGVPTPAYLTATIGDRIHTPTSGSIPGPMAQTGAGSHTLMEHTSLGGVYATKAQVSGGVSTYSNSDANPNLLSAGPYTAPPNGTSGLMVASPSTTKAILCYRSGTTWGGGMLGIAGNVNMAGDCINLTPSGTSGFIPAIAFLTEFKFIMVWSASSLLHGQVCNIG